MKLCIKCGETKPLSEFSKDASKKDGLSSYCRVCHKNSAATIAWRAANREKRKAASAAWRSANKGKVKENFSLWRAKNRDSEIARCAKWRAENPEKNKAAYTAWLKAHPEHNRVKCQNRRVRKFVNGGKLSKGLATRLFKLQRGKCACCGTPLGDDYHLDHRMPLALEGQHTDDNIQLLCPLCNLQKGAKHPVDFMQQRGFLV